ncbi:ring-cleaving dioxygenase [Ancylobacter amanitiformis]|uniref:Glyoxalase family protein n=1 Tax=Ancylobacter amanitiformis TaxID=217069 RepID=A0ABU0LTM5_9HYPH|nr:ring-cleaving dioxygenase [Ancylobacter amanitiformis]MDQ0512030.1 glyoxalase family protein [Ancylobacter amanitiformis]
MNRNGIHHVTAIAGNARRNVEFYTRALGLRLVKKTVNFDDPGTYHFYYGDEAGAPGTILTFFPWDHVAPGRLGIGETQETAFRVPAGSIGYWTQRFIEKGIVHQPIVHRFGETVLAFKDPHGMRLSLIGVPGIENEAAWIGTDVPAEHAIRGFHSVNLLLAEAAPTGAILTDIFGFKEIGREGSLVRFKAEGTDIGGIVDIHEAGGFLPARMGGGSVHHIAFRAADDAAQEEMVRKLVENHGIHTTEQKDRNYFRSVYFREPGHVLFEIATDVPGFDADEPRTTLGEALKLPDFLEGRRRQIEAVLPEIA